MREVSLAVLMATLENATYRNELANVANTLPLLAAVRLNVNGMIDAQIATLEGELLAGEAVH